MEIKKTKVFSKWVIFHSISLLVAFFNFCYLNPFNEDNIHGGGAMFEALGGFIGIMLLPWIIAIINRLWKKQPSTVGHFIVYYIILIFWIFLFVSFGMRAHNYLNLNFWSKFESEARLGLFLTSVFFLIIFYVFRLFFIKVNSSHKIKVNAVHEPDLKPSVSRKRKEKRLLLIIISILLFIVALIVLKELSH